MRLVYISTRALTPVFFVVVESALKPNGLAIALESEDVRGDSIKEPAIVGNYNDATWKVEKRLL